MSKEFELPQETGMEHLVFRPFCCGSDTQGALSCALLQKATSILSMLFQFLHTMAPDLQPRLCLVMTQSSREGVRPCLIKNHARSLNPNLWGIQCPSTEQGNLPTFHPLFPKYLASVSLCKQSSKFTSSALEK